LDFRGALRARETVTRPSPGSDFATSLGRERLLLAGCVRSLVSQHPHKPDPTRAFTVQLLPDGGLLIKGSRGAPSAVTLGVLALASAGEAAGQPSDRIGIWLSQVPMSFPTLPLPG
jgi:hypothetical protein